ncbi:MAG: gliding motility-associated C-terminal domain-containing protein [Bacteroidetes bacterium]|nr:gliding motility-associated C-terminal domain-containing protein [Bacteroidota bacterium]
MLANGLGVFAAGAYFNSLGPLVISNNLLGNISAPNINAQSLATGLLIGNCATANISYNSIYLNSSTNAANAGSSAINFTSPNTTFTLKNNIIHNTSTPSGTGLTVALRNTGGATMDLSSNNNLLYAGSPSANHLLYYDGINAIQSLIAYNSHFAPAEADAKTENVPFISTLGSSTDFLKINPTIPTRVESGAIAIAGLTDDYGNANIRTGYPKPGQVNGGGTAPDIGAHEGDYTPFITDMGITGIISPADGNCYNPDAELIVELTNHLHIPIDFSFFNVAVHASATDPLAVVTNFPPVVLNTGILAAGASMPLSITPSYNMAAPGNYTFSAYSITPEDINILNDSLPIPYVYHYNPGMASIDFNSICVGDSVLVAISATSGSIQWQYSTDGGASWNNQAGTVASTTSFKDYPIVNTMYRAEVCGILSTTVSVDVHSKPMVTLITTDIDCFGAATGVAEFMVSGISAGYNYSWSHTPPVNSNPALNLAAGNYGVEVIDNNGCKGSAQGIINEPPDLLLNVNIIKPVSCFAYSDGEVDFSASGGTGLLSFFQNAVPATAPVSGLSAGTYIYSVEDANGCITSQTINLTEPTQLNISFNVTPSCQGQANGSISSTAAGGTSPYTYNWNTLTPSNTSVVSNIGAGTYTLSITDANLCSHSDSTVLTESNLNISFLKTPSRCSDDLGGSLQAMITGATNPINYLWSNGQSSSLISNLPSGTYSLTATDANACVATAMAEILRDSIGAAASFSWVSTGPLVSFTDLSENAVDWHWDFGNNKSSNLRNPKHRYAKEGSYRVYLFITDINGCKSDYSTEIIVTSEIFIPNVFSPNGDGQNDWFYIVHPGFEEFSIAIFNRWGAKIWETTAPEIRWDGRTSSGIPVPAGTYFYDFKANAAGKNYATKGFFELFR